MHRKRRALAGAVLAVGLGLTGCSDTDEITDEDAGLTVEEEFGEQDDSDADQDGVDPGTGGIDDDDNTGDDPTNTGEDSDDGTGGP